MTQLKPTFDVPSLCGNSASPEVGGAAEPPSLHILHKDKVFDKSVMHKNALLTWPQRASTQHHINDKLHNLCNDTGHTVLPFQRFFPEIMSCTFGVGVLL
eukprot:5289666-Amphidinium_carterae.1